MLRPVVTRLVSRVGQGGWQVFQCWSGSRGRQVSGPCVPWWGMMKRCSQCLAHVFHLCCIVQWGWTCVAQGGQQLTKVGGQHGCCFESRKDVPFLDGCTDHSLAVPASVCRCPVGILAPLLFCKRGQSLDAPVVHYTYLTCSVCLLM